MSRILRNVHASAKALHKAGLLDALTMREFDAPCLPPLHDYSSEDVQRIRAKAKASQAATASEICSTEMLRRRATSRAARISVVR